MKVNLLFGFLGSGKTTLAKHLLAERGTRVKTAIIVNEFGAVGVDGDILRGNSIDVVELNSGCLCCTLRGSLLMAVEELRNKAKVERIIVEATGVAQPSELLESLAEASADQGLEIGPLVTVVDCAKFAKLESMLGDFYLDQIESADILIANKIDLATPEQLRATTRRLREINPAAELMFAEQGRVPVDRLFGEAESTLVQKAREELQAQCGLSPEHNGGHHHPASAHQGHDHDPHHGPDHVHPHDPHAAAPAQSFVVGTAARGTRERVERFFRTLPDNVWRAKGFMRIDEQPTLVQYSLGQIEFTAADHANADCVVFIGRELDQPAIEADLALATR